MLCKRPIIVHLDKFLAFMVLRLHCDPLIIAREGRVNQPYSITTYFSTVFPCTPHIPCLYILVSRIKFCVLFSSPMVHALPSHPLLFYHVNNTGCFLWFFRNTEAFSHRKPAFAGISNKLSSREHSRRRTVCLVMSANIKLLIAQFFIPTFSLLPVSRNICIYIQNPFPKCVRFVCACIIGDLFLKLYTTTENENDERYQLDATIMIYYHK